MLGIPEVHLFFASRTLTWSARRAAGSYGLILASLALWAVSTFVLTSALTWLMRSIGLAVAPSVAGSLSLLLLFLSLWVLVAAVLLVAVNVVNFSLFALVLTRLYQRLAQRTPASLARYAGEVWGIRLRGPSGIGILSLIVWSLTMVVTVKYLTFIMKADNAGEGGILALLALVPAKKAKSSTQITWMCRNLPTARCSSRMTPT